MIRDIDRFPDIQEKKVKIFGECNICGEDILDGETYYKIGNSLICTHCIDDFREVAEVLED